MEYTTIWYSLRNTIRHTSLQNDDNKERGGGSKIFYVI